MPIVQPVFDTTMRVAVERIAAEVVHNRRTTRRNDCVQVSKPVAGHEAIAPADGEVDDRCRIVVADSGPESLPDPRAVAGVGTFNEIWKSRRCLQ